MDIHLAPSPVGPWDDGDPEVNFVKILLLTLLGDLVSAPECVRR